MDKSIEQLKLLLEAMLPSCKVEVDEPHHSSGSWWIDLRVGKKRQTLEYRPSSGFGLFQGRAHYGTGPSEVYKTPQRVAQRLVQLMGGGKRNTESLNFKNLRELYGVSQVQLAEKVGIKQSAISRFEKRDEVKLSTLVAAVKALGGELEVRVHFADSDLAISLDPD